MSDVFEQVNDRSRELIEQRGIEPDRVASMIVEAIKESFCVLSRWHLYEDAMRDRVGALLAGRAPGPVAAASAPSNLQDGRQ
jgi:hypothetical protein